RSSRPAAVPWLAKSGIRSTPATSHRFCCGRRAQRLKSSAWRVPVPIPSTRLSRRPNTASPLVQAGTYSAVLHYFRAMEAAGTVDGWADGDKIRELPVDDFFAKGRARGDGRMTHDMYLVEVKTPSESKAKWDYYKVLRRIPAEEAAQPLSESKCSLIKK